MGRNTERRDAVRRARRAAGDGPVRLLVRAEDRHGVGMEVAFTVYGARGLDGLQRRLAACGLRIAAVRCVARGREACGVLGGGGGTA